MESTPEGRDPGRLPLGVVVVLSILAIALIAAPLSLVLRDKRSGGMEGMEGMVAEGGILALESVDAELAGLYEHAAAHADHYEQIPCFCGCEEFLDHRHLKDCFVRPDGKWEAHGAGCGVCQGEARTVRRMLRAGYPIDEIRAEVIDRFGPM